MTIDEAIKEQQVFLDKLGNVGRQELKDGMRLGIEALKRLEAYRTGITVAYEELLPGETKE